MVIWRGLENLLTLSFIVKQKWFAKKRGEIESNLIPLLPGGGVPNGRGGREYKVMKNNAICIATTSPFGYSPPPPPPLSGESNLPGGGELSYSVFHLFSSQVISV